MLGRVHARHASMRSDAIHKARTHLARTTARHSLQRLSAPYCLLVLSSSECARGRLHDSSLLGTCILVVDTAVTNR
jgi:hypothetical protein